MEKWRLIPLIGIIWGLSLQVVDYFVISIPYVVIIPLDIVAIVLIFAGLVIRKKGKTDEKKNI